MQSIVSDSVSGGDISRNIEKVVGIVKEESLDQPGLVGKNQESSDGKSYPEGA
jgi:hypothetical protein